MRKALVIIACEIAVLGVVVAAFVLNESPGVRVPAISAAAVQPARVPSSIAVSIAIPGTTGRTVTAALSVHGGKAAAVAVKVTTTRR